jgi:hypothetical protein
VLNIDTACCVALSDLALQSVAENNKKTTLEKQKKSLFYC